MIYTQLISGDKDCYQYELDFDSFDQMNFVQLVKIVNLYTGEVSFLATDAD